MEASHIYNGNENEAEEILQYLPPRFRDISATSTSFERFYLMNDDLISARILPALHYGRLCPLIRNATPREPIANRFRHLIDSPLTRPPLNRSLLLRVIEAGYASVDEVKFLDCATRDKRLPRLPNQVLERRALVTDPHSVPNSETGQNVHVAVGEKVVYYTNYDPINPFSYIMNASYNGDWVLRPLDSSTICQEIEREIPVNYIAQVILKSVVGNRLIVLLRFKDLNSNNPKYTLCLDLNTERWSLLPPCPLHGDHFYTPIVWHRKLFLLDNQAGYEDAGRLVPIHLDIERNMWVEDEVNTVLAGRLLELPRRCIQRFIHRWDLGLISSRSGTLYALRDQYSNEYPILDVYAMDDTETGWKRVQLRRSVYTQQFNPLAISPLPSHIPENNVYIRIHWWPVNEHDILLHFLQYCADEDQRLTWARHTWWVFNQNDGVKSHNSEELTLSGYNVSHLSVLKIER